MNIRNIGKPSLIPQSLLYKWENISIRSSIHNVRNMEKTTISPPPLITTWIQTLERGPMIVNSATDPSIILHILL